ncbi:MAG: hypothetical protein QGG42_01475 [Phycisphaerae bacterium]|jgi:hypothetical protein|nr:hypothetical protein [Phycisphaerae bacterium]
MSEERGNTALDTLSDAHHETIKTVHSVRKWVAALAVLGFASWVILAMVISQSRVPSAASGNAAYATSKPMIATDGPWGRLEYSPIVVSPPREYVAESAVDFSGPVVWHFPNVGSTGLSRLLKEIGFDAGLVADLEIIARANVSMPGMSLHPSKEFVLGLSADNRAKLYLALADYPQNTDCRNQFLFRGRTTEEWFAGSDVSPETRKLVEPLIYRHGNFMYFADMRSIDADIPSKEQRLELLRTLRRDSTFLVHVKVSNKEDVDGLVNYWGRAGRVQDVRPILESLAGRPEEQLINITHLLPPLARRKLYTYSARLIQDFKMTRDCHWTTANFFQETPDDKFADANMFFAELREEFYRIHGNLQLGDAALVVDSRGAPVHSATYIADDIFFHRCGSDSSSPWALTKGEDLLGFYPRRGKLTIQYYRRKNM